MNNQKYSIQDLPSINASFSDFPGVFPLKTNQKLAIFEWIFTERLKPKFAEIANDITWNLVTSGPPLKSPPVADPGEGPGAPASSPPLVLDQTETRGAEKEFFWSCFI